MQQAGPPGYQPMMVQPTQPSAQWREFYLEKLRGHGRPVGMPLMMILLSSEGNSFSGANHDGQIYIRSVQGCQAWMWNGTLRPQFRQIEQEVLIRKALRRPRKVEMRATWTQPPHPDPKKNYEALRMQLEDGAIDLGGVCAALGRDFDSIQEARDQVNKELARYNLPPAPINLGNAGGKPADVLRQVAAKLDEVDTLDESDDDQTQKQSEKTVAATK
jgi:capsid protein